MPRVLLPVVFLTLLGVPALADIRDWPASASTDDVQDQNALFTEAISDAAAAGVDMVYAARVIGRLRYYIEGSTNAGKSSAVCLGMLVEVVKATARQNWTVERASQLLIEFQKELEILGGRCSSYPDGAMSFLS